LSKQYPAQFGHNPQYANPNNSLPSPAPQGMPVTLWEQTPGNVDWTAMGNTVPAQDFRPVGTQFTFTWRSPTFDLRPDLRSADAQVKYGIPIWSRSARLRFTIRDINVNTVAEGHAMQNMQVVVQNWGNALSGRAGTPNTGANTIVPITPAAVITNSFMLSAVVGAQGRMVTLAPPGTGAGGGDGYPLRYWQAVLTFTKTYETALFPNASDGPPFSFQAVCY
jgi:hypothetical protein